MQQKSEVLQSDTLGSALTGDLTQMAQESEAAQRAASGSAQAGRKTRLSTKISNLPPTIKKMRRMGPEEERYVPPPRPYELPAYRKGMRYSKSKEKYLRPLRLTNPREPNVVAVAHELGAYELPDREFAEAAYWWMKTNLRWVMTKWYGAGETLARGRGTCWHLNNTYAAICRCAGIKARYKAFDTKMFQSGAESLSAVDATAGNPLASGNRTLPEAEVEVFIDGTWVTAYVAQPTGLSAGAGWPVTDFGESGIGLYFDEVPGSTKFSESVPSKMAYPVTLLNLFVPATFERLNVKMKKVQERGLADIEAAGGLKAYNQKARRRRASLSPNEILAQLHAEHEAERAAKIKIK
jgi:Transglutaminase-like superfamily